MALLPATALYSYPLLNVIERLNVKTKLFWEQVHLTMPSPAIDIGCIQAGVNEILWFGGWNYTPKDLIFMVKVESINHFLVNYEEYKLSSPDSFPLNGTYYIESDGMRICGREYIHQLDVSSMRCISKRYKLQ